MDLIYVEWIDARGVGGDWQELVDMKSVYCVCKSVGWLIKEDDDMIHICPHLGDEPEQGCGDMVIPKISVKKRVKLSVG